MEMMRYECVAETVTTADGYRMAAGCICRQQAAEDIRAELASRHVIDHKVKQEKMT